MQPWFGQLRDIARALKYHLHFRGIERGTPEALKTYQQIQLNKIVRHAVQNSPYYGRLCKGLDLGADISLLDLPVIDKRLMMDNFDEWVTDPRLQIGKIEHQLEADPDEQYYLGEYRLVVTSGSSGFRGIFVYDRNEWSIVIAAAFRWAEMFGISPVELGYKKLASIKADSSGHATSRLGQSMNLGIRNLLMLDATQSLADLTKQLNDYQPQLLMGYASMISLLANEQIEGRLKIEPEVIATFSEIMSDDRLRRVLQAWNITPFNHYGAAEQVMIAADCEAHMGLHHFSDMSIVEIVDEHNNPVPPGTPGHKVLLTNLHKFVQPIIRYEITDIVTAADRNCSCTRPFPLFSNIGGRTEDVIHMTGAHGERVSISPMVVSYCLSECPEVIEFQYMYETGSLKVIIVPKTDSERSEVEKAVRNCLESSLTRQGAANFSVTISFVESFPRSSKTMGKLKLSIDDATGRK
ncbi:Phenylacetate-coenzyme A ligase [Roseibium album]|nr:Phenylacetate-coenzyme A ligase [Roseibium album]